MRFGTVDTFLSLNPADLKIGRNVANHEFLKALLTYGSFQAYHFFLPDLEHLEVFRQRLSLVLPDAELRRRIHPTLQVALKEVIGELEFTVFHQGDFTRYLPYLAPLRDRYARTRFPLTGVTHSLNTHIMAQRYLQLGMARLEPFDAIICTSQAGEEVVRRGYQLMQKRMLESFGLDLPLGARLARIPLGIDDARFALPDRRLARESLGLPRDATLLLCVGRLSARAKMDLDPLLHGLAERWRAGRLENLTLLLAGGAEAADLAHLQALLIHLGIRARVILKPDFSDTEKGLLYAAADLFIALSDNLQETFGLAVIEAMAAGLAPIVSDYDGYRELVDHGSTGFRIPTLWGPPVEAVADLDNILAGSLHPFYLAQTFAVDLSAALDAVERLYGDPGARERMGKAARAEARSYRWSAVIPRYEALWLELAGLARQTPRPPARSPHPLETDPMEVFGHYPTAMLEPHHRLRLTAQGRRVVEGEPAPRAHLDFELLLHPPLIRGLLEALGSGSSTVAALDGQAGALGIPTSIIGYHLLWLVKYGLVSLETPLSPREAGR